MPDSETRRAPLATHSAALTPGLPGIWGTALATVAILAFEAVLLWIVVVNSVGWFWPQPIWELALADGSTVVGERAGRELVPPSMAAGEHDRYRIRLKVGNRDVDGRDFLWLDEAEIRRASTPAELVRVIRAEYGDAFGRIVSAHQDDGVPVDVSSRGAVESFLEVGAALRAQRSKHEDELERLRQPLTRLEEELDLLERSARAETPQGAAAIAELAPRVAQLAGELAPRLAAVEQSLVELNQRLDSAGLILAAGEQQLTVPLGAVHELVWSNTMTWFARCCRALEAMVAFLVDEPREANTEGGIFPALFGTVLLVLLMSLAVVPLGVVTAVYMTEYARQGFLLRLANQAVNNLAGVPSIVFGMFGLAFFVYGVGGSMDRLFFSDRLPTPTFGTGGVLWASLTLALLTVPVVVVATREGLLAVPRSWREGALALGATRWQTLLTITLPAAMQGILTGLIMAVSRAAGEVAPLMLTGAVKMAPSLPVDGSFPFLHLERKFMHLGFHIYDVSMQSPNVEAAKPMAFATTLVLLALVVAMNLTAIVVRRRLRASYGGQAV